MDPAGRPFHTHTTATSAWGRGCRTSPAGLGIPTSASKAAGQSSQTQFSQLGKGLLPTLVGRLSVKLGLLQRSRGSKEWLLWGQHRHCSGLRPRPVNSDGLLGQFQQFCRSENGLAKCKPTGSTTWKGSHRKCYPPSPADKAALTLEWVGVG